ncbi:DNA primase [Bacillus thuringiensis]|uniref:phage/plasmid primase, P4 family n=1 Tax=Bacillus tropicus TaxID=2026188 RepID=UPI000B43A1D5|nr:phage/plasmid primase, P4 family [Bacillus tropicus]MED3036038.1 phage/plasmid primase, P4 family [Bacillus tropicus]OTX90024.1 DNA primase [Bacillus thuringiensis serovar chanpaisis]PNK23950.1 DNA primase [Bacillus thuringiensis]
MKKNPYNFNEIPAELKALPQWILWKFEMRNGKQTKVPCQVTGEMAQANNRRTWSTFATAVKFYLEGDYDGIGFVFSRQDNYIGIDIDKCVVDGKTNAFATEIIDTLDSYTEFSPSGKGIHIIIKGSLPQSVLGTGRKNTKHGLEIYSYGRFFTFTGNRENSNDVYDRTDELAEVFEQYFDDSDIQGRVNLAEFEKDEIKISNEALWERMFRSKNGDEIRSMYNGNLINDDHSATDLALCNHLAFWTGKSATRMDAMFRETSLIRDKWDVIHYSDTNETYGERTIGVAISSTSTTILDNKQQFEEFSFDFIHEDVAEVVEDKPKRKFKLTEMGNAERIAYEYGHVIKYINDIGWYIWDGKRWKVDTKKEIERITAKVLRSLSKSEDEAEAKWSRMCERRNIRMNSIKDLMPLVPGERGDFDRHKFLFNVENGVVDLKTGKLLQHDRELGLTKITNISFDENAKCPEWLKFLDQIFLGDQTLVEYMQRLIGYSLTGDISEQIMMFLVGGGSNGKSTFINTIKDLMGDYGKQAKSDTFIKKKESGANNDIARLVGSRFVSAIESEEGEKLADSFVKQITGGEPVLARFLRQEFFEFIPEFKVFFTTNHKPIIGGLDEGIWRRVKLIPFNLSLPAHKRDKRLPEKLSLEMPGILNWAIEGCMKWQQDGLKEPKVVSEATGKYKDDMDILAPFLDEICYVDEQENESIMIEAKELYNTYERWCFNSGERSLGNRSFYRMLETKGFGKTKGTGNKTFLTGITLNERKPVTKGVTETSENSKFKVTQ